MGVSGPVTELVVNVRVLTLAQLRPMLMYDQRNRMKKRSVVWQEVIYLMKRLPNLYDRDKLDLTKFQFGFCKKENLQDIQLVHPKHEDKSIASLIGATDFFAHDLIIVPITQLNPDNDNKPPEPLPKISSPEKLAAVKSAVDDSEFISSKSSPNKSVGLTDSQEMLPKKKKKVKKKGLV